MNELPNPPFLPGFEPGKAWPPEHHRRLLEAAASGEPTALWGPPGSAFAAAAWAFHRAGPATEIPLRRFDLSHLPRQARLRAWASQAPPSGGLLWMEHAELIPSARRSQGARAGRLASFEVAAETESGLFPSWRPVRVPVLALYPRLEECLQTAWKSLTGETLLKPIAALLKGMDRPGDLGELERLLVEAASRGREFLTQRLNFPEAGGGEKSYWKSRKRQLENSLVEEALRKTGGNQAEAARTLGLHRNTLLWHLRRIRRGKA